MGGVGRRTDDGFRRGEVRFADLDPVIDHEQGGRRPALVILSDLLHAIPSRLVIVVPITSRDRGVRLHVAIYPPEGGLNRLSFAMPEQLRSVSRRRLMQHLGMVSPDTLDLVLARVRLFLDL